MRIAFLGDSLTEGWPGAAYFPQLVRRFPQHELLNRGRAGDTVADLLLRMRHRGLETVDAAFIWVGANDAVIGSWDAAEPGSGWSWDERMTRIRGDYEVLLEWTAARAPRLVLVEPLILEAEGSVWEDHAAEVADVVRELAAERAAAGAPCRALDLRPAFAAARAAGAGPFTTDGVHFTDAGAAVVAKAMGDVVTGLEHDHASQGGPT